MPYSAAGGAEKGKYFILSKSLRMMSCLSIIFKKIKVTKLILFLCTFFKPFKTEVAYKIELQSVIYLGYFRLRTYFYEHTLRNYVFHHNLFFQPGLPLSPSLLLFPFFPPFPVFC